VPIIVYCLMPLATSLPLIKAWLKRTKAPPSDEPWRTLDLGLSIFTPPPPPKLDAALVARLDALERKVDALKAKGAEYHADLVEVGRWLLSYKKDGKRVYLADLHPVARHHSPTTAPSQPPLAPRGPRPPPPLLPSYPTILPHLPTTHPTALLTPHPGRPAEALGQRRPIAEFH